MTRFFYDLEFIEDGRTIVPISIGIVDDHGREFYAVVEEIDSDEQLHQAICRHRWIMMNVVRHLPLRLQGNGRPVYEVPDYTNRHKGHFSLDTSDLRVLPLRVIVKQVRAFLTQPPPEDQAEVHTFGQAEPVRTIPAAPPGQVELWADYGAYDHVALAQMFGDMTCWPDQLPMFTHDIQQEAARLGVNTAELLPQDVMRSHDALADAQHVRALYGVLQAEQEPGES